MLMPSVPIRGKHLKIRCLPLFIHLLLCFDSEFSHVALVLIDDHDAKGNLFNYERLFEVEPLSKTDEKNIEEGRETSIDRTLRLLYVTCTRAKHSLALLMYTSNPKKAKATALAKGWFNDDEMSIMV